MDFFRKNHFIGITYCSLLLGLLAHDAFGQEKRTTFSLTPILHSWDSCFDNKIRNEVNKYLGVRYRRGGSSKRGVDCSGFVRLIYRNVFGVNLPSIASYQCSLPIFKKVSVDKLMTGDLIFFSPTHKKKRINHVGLYLSDGHFAHAIRKKGVIISSLENRHWKSRIISVKRIVIRQASDESGAI